MKDIILIMIVILASTIPAAATSAAEAILPIKARIVRCVTNEERRQMCQQENLCCHLVDTEMASGVSDEQAMSDISKNEDMKVYKISHDDFISLSLE